MKINFPLAKIFFPKKKSEVKKPHLNQMERDTFTYSRYDKLNKYSSNIRYEKDKNAKYISNLFWVQRITHKGFVSPWKIHIYSDDAKDWQKLLNAIGPYLDDNNCCWKTVCKPNIIKKLNDDKEQKGKAVVVTPSCDDDFRKIVSDIDYIIKNNNLCIKNKNIVNDRELGNSGRIFYRYGLNSGIFKNRVFNLSNYDDEKIFRSNYGRGYYNKENPYLAEDMTVNDDPFYNFVI